MLATPSTIIHAIEDRLACRSAYSAGGAAASPPSHAFPGQIADGTLALAAVGAAAGGALLPAGLSVLGMTLTGATIGSQIGAFAGSCIGNALFGASGQKRSVEGPRLSDLHVTSSTEGAPIPRLYGRARLGGQIIWSDEIRETISTSRSGGSGKGAPRSGRSRRRPSTAIPRRSPSALPKA